MTRNNNPNRRSTSAGTETEPSLSRVFLLKVRPVGYDGNNPTSVAEWLESLELGDYTKSFLINGYTSMELVKKIWEIELINVSPLFQPACVRLHKVQKMRLFLEAPVKERVTCTHSWSRSMSEEDLQLRYRARKL